MRFEEKIVDQMQAAGAPKLPDGHPVLSGKVHRFGPQKKWWYVARTVTLKSGREVLQGSFGCWHGDDNGAIDFESDTEVMTEADRAEMRRSLAAAEKVQAEKRADEARRAANRAGQEWKDAQTVASMSGHPYLLKKQVESYGLRVNGKNELLIPFIENAGFGLRVQGLQKIDAAGEKRFSSGMEKAGAGFVIGPFASTDLIYIGEGYATCASAYAVQAGQHPAVVAFDAGSLLDVAKQVRALFPSARIVFLADDDYQLEERMLKRLQSFWGVAAPVIDLASPMPQVLKCAQGHDVIVHAELLQDAHGVPGIQAKVQKASLVKAEQFLNAGRTKSHAAADAVGNAVVVYPRFTDRTGKKWTDFNDLQAAEGAGVVASQIFAAIAAPDNAAADTAADFPLPPDVAEQPQDFARAPSPPQGQEDFSAAGAPHVRDSADDADKNEPVKAEAIYPLEVILRNCALVIGTTDVYDELNDIHFKKQAFIAAVGKENYQAWLSSPERRSIDQKKVEKQKPAPAGGGKGGKRADFDDDFFTKVGRLVDSFTLIYGSDEVFDGERRELLKIGPLRLAFTPDVVKTWLNCPDRKMVPRENLVFDPTYSVDPKTHLNLFDGFAMKPVVGECNQILLLLRHLCGDDDTFEWVLKWIAYPLQNPGAKMATAIVMHGDEGSGKNLFFEKCVKQIYGKYASVIGNQEIESQFNEWASQKLFMVCDEVVTRAEMRQLKGRLKQITANETIQINPKNLTPREERNHINFVFLSNETQPLALDKTDRRYMVVWTPPKLGPEFYSAAAAEMESGGTEAFYHFLLNLELGDFNAHTKPLMTEAKMDLIELGLSPTERFYREWAEQRLPVPYICCTAQQLYDAFLRWCALQGERFPPSQARFGRDVKRAGSADMRAIPVMVTEGASKRQLTCYWISGQQPEGVTKEAHITATSNLFDGALRAYRRRMDGISEPD
ncbi:DUF5906 domain-containing protein [Undibacterium squillarum]|uniref:NrS-1 polymerase-like helicase domain-containing protein n=1 Tax=Undibacterium squillarum TaxID=1131567 RepID=A0ABQ2Y2E5_9BURK|nr:DUF5906 domain-containing protein [Undibacterium squillarum]GGX53107.1 hypothetical protein GCM10010946_34620 [Undibacterium squillarum]